MLNGNGEWPDELSTAITFLDAEHRKLAQGYLELMRDVQDKTEPRHFLEDFRNLLEETRAHFVHEERIMGNINYPHLYEHRIAHNRLLDDFADFLNNIGNGFAKQDFHALAEYFKYWFLDHVRGYDVKLKFFIDRFETEPTQRKSANSP